jgi:hypothetical protein
MRVVGGDPCREGPGSGEGTGPCLPPETFLFPRAPHPLGVGMALRGVIARQGRLDCPGPTGLHVGGGGRLTAVGTPHRKPLALGALRALASDGHLQGREPRRRWAPHPSRGPDARHGPIAPHDEVAPPRLPPAPGSSRGPTMRAAGWAWVGSLWVAAALDATRWGGHQPLVRPQEAQAPWLVARPRCHEAPRRPETAVTPVRVLRLQGVAPWPQAWVPLSPPGRGWAAHPHTSALVVRARVKAPTRVVRCACCRVRRASRGL